MSAGRVILVRHAQASFGSDDYDTLSEHGLLQAKRLGEWMATQEREIVWLVRGTMKRHAQTVAAIESACEAAAKRLPSCIVDADWNEFDHTVVVRAYASAHADDPLLQTAKHGDKRAMFHVLAAALRAWSNGEFSELAESWKTFAARVERARDRLTYDAPDGTALVISSGGTISRCAQAALGIDNEHTIELNLGLRNTAVSEFRRDEVRWALQTWNAFPQFAEHDERRWVTYY